MNFLLLSTIVSEWTSSCLPWSHCTSYLGSTLKLVVVYGVAIMLISDVVSGSAWAPYSTCIECLSTQVPKYLRLLNLQDPSAPRHL